MKLSLFLQNERQDSSPHGHKRRYTPGAGVATGGHEKQRRLLQNLPSFETWANREEDSDLSNDWMSGRNKR